MLRPNEIGALKELRAMLESEFRVVELRLFGSKARGDDQEDSDIDVMVVLEDYNPVIESRIDDIAFEVGLRNNCLISLTIFGKKEIENGPLDESPLYKRVREEGISI